MVILPSMSYDIFKSKVMNLTRYGQPNLKQLCRHCQLTGFRFSQIVTGDIRLTNRADSPTQPRTDFVRESRDSREQRRSNVFAPFSVSPLFISQNQPLHTPNIKQLQLQHSTVMGCTISSTSASNSGIAAYNATIFMNNGSLIELPITNVYSNVLGYDFRYPPEQEILPDEERPDNVVLLGCSNPFYDLLHMEDDVVEAGIFPAICNVERENASGQSGFVQFATITDSDLDAGLFDCAFPSSTEFVEGTRYGGIGGSQFNDIPALERIPFNQGGVRISSIVMSDGRFGQGARVIPFSFQITYELPGGTEISIGNGSGNRNRELVFDHTDREEYITEAIITNGLICANAGIGSCIDNAVVRVEVITNKGNSVAGGAGRAVGRTATNRIRPNVREEMIVGIHGTAGDIVDSLGVVLIRKGSPSGNAQRKTELSM